MALPLLCEVRKFRPPDKCVKEGRESLCDGAETRIR